ncbi:unnamed protein product [Peronospora farinosa]|uniref:Uncharacterized protein n=1 Tax=Peronospora farinosa TaxID=134698 RepID=A0ABN8C687_9STRA|nr:unnamed protein product [Peronospora farinosa]
MNKKKKLEEMKQLKLLKEQNEKDVQLKLQEKKGKLLNLMEEIKWAASFTIELKKAKTNVLKEMLISRTNTPDKLTYDEKKNLKELLEGWNPTASESESKSSTEGFKAWLENEELPDKLFTVLGIHKAGDKLANNFLISMNLERWNFVMNFLDETGHYNFEDKLTETLTAFCRDNNRATLFLERLVILTEQTDLGQLKWLHEKIEPKEVFNRMKIPDKNHFYKVPNLAKWSTYVDAYNELYPELQTTLIAALPYEEPVLINKLFFGTLNYPASGTLVRRLLDEMLMSWAKLHVSLADASTRLELLLKDTYISTVRLKALQQYMILINAQKQHPANETLANLIKDFINKSTVRNDPNEIKRLQDYLTPQIPLKRKPESPLKMMYVTGDDPVAASSHLYLHKLPSMLLHSPYNVHFKPLLSII